MKKFHFLSIVAIIVALFLSAASPAPIQLLSSNMLTDNDLIRLTIVNNGSDPVVMKLRGLRTYNFVVEPNTTRVLWPQSGFYKYDLYACGLVSSGKIDLTFMRIVTLPECGGRIRDYSDIHQLDLSSDIRPMKFTVINGNPQTVNVKLVGPQNYFLTVGGNTTGSYGLVTGVYKYTVYVCGTSVSGTLDLSIYKDLTIPVCGANAKSSADIHDENVSLRKIVRVSITNHSSVPLSLRMDGPTSYVLLIQPDESKTLSFLRGSYTYVSYGCNDVSEGSFYAKHNASLDLSCSDEG